MTKICSRGRFSTADCRGSA